MTRTILATTIPLSTIANGPHLSLYDCHCHCHCPTLQHEISHTREEKSHHYRKSDITLQQSKSDKFSRQTPNQLVRLDTKPPDGTNLFKTIHSQNFTRGGQAGWEWETRPLVSMLFTRSVYAASKVQQFGANPCGVEGFQSPQEISVELAQEGLWGTQTIKGYLNTLEQ